MYCSDHWPDIIFTSHQLLSCFWHSLVKGWSGVLDSCWWSLRPTHLPMDAMTPVGSSWLLLAPVRPKEAMLWVAILSPCLWCCLSCALMQADFVNIIFFTRWCLYHSSLCLCFVCTLSVSLLPFLSKQLLSCLSCPVFAAYPGLWNPGLC